MWGLYVRAVGVGLSNSASQSIRDGVAFREQYRVKVLVVGHLH